MAGAVFLAMPAEGSLVRQSKIAAADRLAVLAAADASPLLEPPGFLLVNYGASTPVVMLVAHLVYGAIVGEFVALSG